MKVDFETFCNRLFSTIGYDVVYVNKERTHQYWVGIRDKELLTEYDLTMNEAVKENGESKVHVHFPGISDEVLKWRASQKFGKLFKDAGFDTWDRISLHGNEAYLTLYIPDWIDWK